ncbi:probable disease resistance protein At1g59620 [Henckelia pumila]|uniref:probable disease resistance protein At1g59620 n=1 Tax=Henckelia pumila TaxID=405737 RepID=UPI003C6E1B31
MESAVVSAVLGGLLDRLKHLMADEEGYTQLISELAALATAHKYDLVSKLGAGKDVRELAYEIEDSIESYVMVREAGNTCWSLRKFFLGWSLKNDLSVFQKKIKEVKKRMIITSNKLDSSLEESSTTPAEFGLGGMGKTRNINDHYVVGLDGDVEMLSSNNLVGGKDKLSVVAIVGLGGMGKTTLARLLFDHHPVQKHFERRIWAHAGVEFQGRGILEYILSDVYPDWSLEKKIEEMESVELMEGIYQALHGKRYVVVLDDIYDWETIRFAFPDDHNGSRVIITSRFTDIARRSPNYYTHHMRPLTLEESWELMKTRLVGHHNHLDMEAKEIGLQIIRHCRGVPLLIVVVGSQCRLRQLEDWKKLLQHLVEHQYEAKSDEYFIDFSYKMLPVHLKPCFLYLGHFPTDHHILIEKLYLLWIAEGFVSKKDLPDISKFDIAENYFKALAERSMVMVQDQEQVFFDKSCQIHDLLRELCLVKAMEEEFFRVVDFGRGNHKRAVSHRLAIYLNMQESAVSLDMIPEAKSVRSLLFYEKNGPLTKPNSQWPAEAADLKEFRRARVLDFDGVDFRVKQLPKSIKRLVYLRHLSFRGCYLLEFPSSFSNLSFLETLDLLVHESCRITIANVLWNFKRLRYLYLPVVFLVQNKAQEYHDHKLKLNGLTELEILENFHAGLCDANDLEMLYNVQRFTGVVDGNNDDLEKIFKHLKHWKIASSGQSSLVVKNFDCYSEKRFLIVENLLTRCKALPVLEIEGHLPRLPGYTDISPNFTEMVFSRSELIEQDPMQILGKLPKLRSLVLSNNAFAAYKMVCSKSDFPELKILKLAMLQRLNRWEVDSGAMPKLAILVIEQCKGLEMLPDELMEITTLKELKIGSMPRKFQDKVRSMAAQVPLRVTMYST